MASAGQHLLMDGYVRDSGVFTRERLEAMFARLLAALEMQPLDKAMHYEVPVDPAILERVKLTGKFEDEGGLSSIQVLSTSHLSLHSWPLQRFFSADCFSCKEFNAPLSRSILLETLGVTTFNMTVVNRRKPEPAEQLVHYFDV